MELAWLLFPRYSPFPSTIETDMHDIAEILLKLALNTMGQFHKKS